MASIKRPLLQIRWYLERKVKHIKKINDQIDHKRWERKIKDRKESGSHGRESERQIAKQDWNFNTNMPNMTQMPIKIKYKKKEETTHRNIQIGGT